MILGARELRGTADLLAVVADGMGGGNHGDVASETVVRAIPEAVSDLLSAGRPEAEPDPAAVLREAIRRANTAVWMRQVNEPALQGMGSTCVAAIIAGGVLHVAHVGDSRAYLLRAGALRQITEDHSLVWQQVQSGAISRDEARTSRFRNAITRAVGLDATIEPDVVPVRLADGDVLLLCTDGLTTEVDDHSVARLLAVDDSPASLAGRLVDAALAAGGSDNITAVVVRVGEQTWEDGPIPAVDDEPTTALRPIQSDSGTSAHDVGSGPRNGTRARRSGSRTRRQLALTRGIAGILAVAVVVETGALIGRSYRPPQAPAPVSRPPDLHRRFTYGPALPLLTTTLLRDTPLRLSPDGTFLAVSQDGEYLRIGSDNAVTRLSGTAVVARVREPLRIQRYIAVDSAGYWYESDPSARVIRRYSPAGTRISADIGKGTLLAPADLAIGPSGDIFVIDNHILKRLQAAPATAQAPGTTPTGP